MTKIATRVAHTVPTDLQKALLAAPKSLAYRTASRQLIEEKR